MPSGDSQMAPPAGYQQQQNGYFRWQGGYQAGYQQHGYQPTVQPTESRLIIVNEARPANYLLLSCIIYWVCNPIFGGFAFAYSMASSSAADEGDMDQARRLGLTAKTCSLVGICVTVPLIVFVVTYCLLRLEADQNETC